MRPLADYRGETDPYGFPLAASVLATPTSSPPPPSSSWARPLASLSPSSAAILKRRLPARAETPFLDQVAGPERGPLFRSRGAPRRSTTPPATRPLSAAATPENETEDASKPVNRGISLIPTEIVGVLLTNRLRVLSILSMEVARYAGTCCGGAKILGPLPGRSM